MQTYTIKQVKATGAVDPQFGTEYIVQFNEDERIVTVNRKNVPTEGDSWEGEITVSKWGTKFKKAPFVPGQSQAPQSTAAQGSTFATKPAYKDNSDGMKQGMAINNAAAYIAATVTDVQTADAWSSSVIDYAKKLYDKSDLNGLQGDAIDVTGNEDVKTVLDAFSK